MTTEVRVERALPIGEYHAHKSLGSTDLKTLEQSAHVFRLLRDGEKTRPDTASLALGRLWHTLLDLTPEVFGERSVVVPNKFCLASGGVSTKKEAKEFLASLPDEAIPVTPEASEQLGRMLDLFQANAAAWDIYENLAHQEVSIFWEWGGVAVKCRPDAITGEGVLVDWKSTSEANPLADFGRSVRKFGYGLSAALYEEGCRVAGLASPPMHFVVTSTTSFETQVLTLPPAYTANCRDRLLDLLSEYVEREESNNWMPNGYGEINEIEMWGYGKQMERVL